MKLTIIVCLFLVLYAMFFLLTEPKNIKKAVIRGAKTKIVLKVVDDKGNTIKNAKIETYFEKARQRAKERPFWGYTDNEGYYKKQARSSGRVTYYVTKDGYYDTCGTINFYDKDLGKCFYDNKWQPYGEVVEVVLKPIKHPIGMNSYLIDKPMEETNVLLGFDFQKRDFMPPYGKGLVSDLTIKYQRIEESNSCFQATIIFSFTNLLDGAYVGEKDVYSSFPFSYNATTNEIYKNEFVFLYNQMNNNILDTTLKENQYLVLRTRTKVNETNKLIEAYYSVIPGHFSVTGNRIMFYVYSNPYINSTNLEYDMGKKSEWIYYK